ncbi:hypothetical protein CMK18_21060 [Candidatus Poribacteria bacterium]|nr:hypothetical protein [Candidatus Poribacteria bacterium]
MVKIRRCFLSVTFFLLVQSYEIESSTFDALHVPLDDPMLSQIYDFVDRMLLKYEIFPFHANIRPYTYGQLKQLLNKFQKCSLPVSDRQKIESYLLYFSQPESFVAYETGSSKFRLNLELGSHITSRKKSESQRNEEYAWQIRPILTGQLGKDLSFSTDLRFFLITGRNLPNTIRTEVEVDQRNTKSFDTGGLAPSYLQFQLPWFDLLIGKQNLCWGPGRNGNLILSANSMPMEMIYLRGLYDKVAFQAFHGVAQDPKGNKIVSGHRIDLCPFPWINLGISEVIVVDVEDFNLRFLNPVTIYTISELSGEGYFSNGDNYSKGNLLISGEISVKPTRKIKTYIEIMIDDFQPRYGWKSHLHWGSKWGILSGIRITDLFSLKNTCLLFEYAFLNQYAYTHAKPLNIYSHLNRPIGHKIGPDSQSIFTHLKYEITSNLSLSSFIEFTARGEQKITEPRSSFDDQDGFWIYLSGIEEKSSSVGLSTEFSLMSKQIFKAEYIWEQTKNAYHREGKTSFNQEANLIYLYRF